MAVYEFDDPWEMDTHDRAIMTRMRDVLVEKHGWEVEDFRGMSFLDVEAEFLDVEPDFRTGDGY